jgi:hypothetical protein
MSFHDSDNLPNPSRRNMTAKKSAHLHHTPQSSNARSNIPNRTMVPRDRWQERREGQERSQATFGRAVAFKSSFSQQSQPPLIRRQLHNSALSRFGGPNHNPNRDLSARQPSFVDNLPLPTFTRVFVPTSAHLVDVKWDTYAFFLSSTPDSKRNKGIISYTVNSRASTTQVLEILLIVT